MGCTGRGRVAFFTISRDNNASFPSGMAGKGGAGNYAATAGHYDASGGHDIVDASGRGGAGAVDSYFLLFYLTKSRLGNIGQHITERDGLGHKRRVSAADKLIGMLSVCRWPRYMLKS